MIKSIDQSAAEAVDDFALLSLRVFWCSDCHADQLFEKPPTDTGEHGVWACTDCGAAYFDGIDVVVEVAAADRGIA